MGKATAPQLKKFMDKQVHLKLNGNRSVAGTLRGFDPFMNVVLDHGVDMSTPERTPVGMVVVRGNSIVMIEGLERI
eukprot:m.265559 g.265559  ORF g.265559 m.265559 type:complete len:76 (-) comp29178_c0_seq1:124-351(-)